MSRLFVLAIPALVACSAVHWPHVRDAERVLEMERMGPDETVKITPLHEDWRQTVNLVQIRRHVELHYHETHTEYIYVLEGEGILTIGLEQEQIEVRVEGDELVVSGEREIEREQPGERFHRVERPYGKFIRRFNLPSSVDREAIEATFRDGQLRVTLPNRGDSQPRPLRVSIQ